MNNAAYFWVPSTGNLFINYLHICTYLFCREQRYNECLMVWSLIKVLLGWTSDMKVLPGWTWSLTLINSANDPRWALVTFVPPHVLHIPTCVVLYNCSVLIIFINIISRSLCQQRIWLTILIFFFIFSTKRITTILMQGIPCRLIIWS